MRKRFELVPFSDSGGASVFSTNQLRLAKLARFLILGLTGRVYYLLDTSQHSSLRDAYIDFTRKSSSPAAPSDE